MLARAPGRRCAGERRTNNRSPPAAGFTPPGLGQRGSVPGYAGSERARRAAHRGHISQRRAVTARGPRPALPLRSAPALHTYHRPAKDTSSGPGVRAARIGPLPGDQATMPPQDGAPRDQPVRPQPSRQEPDQRGQHRPAGPVPPGPGQVRRSTATSCRSTSSSASVNAGERPAGQASQQAARRSDRADATTRPVLMPSSHAAPIAPGHSHRPASGTPRAHRCSSQAGQASGTPRVDIATGAPVLVDPGSTLCGCRTAYSPLRGPSCRR